MMATRIRQSNTDLERIFTLRPFTRIIGWGRDFKRVLSYQILNQLEALGFISYKKKKLKTKDPGKYANLKE